MQPKLFCHMSAYLNSRAYLFNHQRDFSDISGLPFVYNGEWVSAFTFNEILIPKNLNSSLLSVYNMSEECHSTLFYLHVVFIHIIKHTVT